VVWIVALGGLDGGGVVVVRCCGLQGRRQRRGGSWSASDAVVVEQGTSSGVLRMCW